MSHWRRVMPSLIFLLVTLSACGRGVQPTPLPRPEPAIEPTASPASIATILPPTEPARPPEVAEDATPVAQAAALPPAVSTDLGIFLEDLVYRPGDPPSRKAPGAVLLVDTPNGRFVEAAGVSELESGRALSVDDRFEIGSITKLFTAVLLLQLHEEGLLSLDDTLAFWLPELAAQLPHGDTMTLRQLASHTAGLDDYERALYPMPNILTDSAALERGYTPQELAAWLAENNQPLFTPGAPGQWRYSSAGYALLALVLEAATGERLGNLYQTRIFDPLGLQSAILLQGVPEAGQIVNGYNAMQGEYIDVTRWNASGAWSAGALAMNAGDLAEFAVALMEGRLFSQPETLSAMADFVPTGQDRGFVGYGLGLAELADGAWGHAGGTPGFAALLVLLPEEGMVGIYLGNSGTANVNPEAFSGLVSDAIH